MLPCSRPGHCAKMFFMHAPHKPQSPNATSASDVSSPNDNWVWKQARRIVIAVIGTTVLLIGIAMMVLPGPGTIVIPIGLAILATEFVWAKRLLAYARERLQEVVPEAAQRGWFRRFFCKSSRAAQDDSEKTSSPPPE
jgi:uncharacterized protein (TIGR02611 family)